MKYEQFIESSFVLEMFRKLGDHKIYSTDKRYEISYNGLIRIVDISDYHLCLSSVFVYPDGSNMKPEYMIPEDKDLNAPYLILKNTLRNLKLIPFDILDENGRNLYPGVSGFIIPGEYKIFANLSFYYSREDMDYTTSVRLHIRKG